MSHFAFICGYIRVYIARKPGAKTLAFSGEYSGVLIVLERLSITLFTGCTDKPDPIIPVMAASRNEYTALPTEAPNHLEDTPSNDDARQNSWSDRLESVKVVANANTGLLLVMTAQFFFACMDVSVKRLHSLDEPVPTLEVRRLSCSDSSEEGNGD